MRAWYNVLGRENVVLGVVRQDVDSESDMSQRTEEEYWDENISQVSKRISLKLVHDWPGFQHSHTWKSVTTSTSTLVPEKLKLKLTLLL